MTCLACGAPTAALEHGATADLADVLCLEHLIAAMAPDVAYAPVLETVHNRTCSGLGNTCPRAVTRHYVNASYCPMCAPPPRADPLPPIRSSGYTATTVPAALGSLGGTVLYETHTYGEPLEDS